MIRVAIVDDQEMIRDGFAAILQRSPNTTVAFLASDGNDYLDKLQAGSRPDVVLMDLQMPGLGGVEAIERSLRLFPELRILVVTTFDEDALVIDAVSAGAYGYLLKRSSGQQLIDAVTATSQGMATLSGNAAKVVLERVRSRRSEPTAATGSGDFRHGKLLEALTTRESEVLALMAGGANNAEIAARLTLSMSTVKSHIANILHKTHSRDRVQAVLVALQAGLGPLPPRHD